MEIAKEVIMTMKQQKKSYVGYGMQKESEALVKHILLNMVNSPMPDMKPDEKNEEDSIRYREEGNQHFVAGDDTEAIESYTMSLAYANTNELMAYAHANRSAALYRKQMFKECLKDIDTALDLGYPPEKRIKLKQRGAKALAELKKLLDTVEDEEKKVAINGNENSLKSNENSLNGNENSLNGNENSINGNENSIDVLAEGCPFETADDSSAPNKKFPLISVVEKEEAKEIQKEAVAVPQVDTKKFTDSFNSKVPPGTSVKPRHLQDPDVMALKYGPCDEAPVCSAGVRITYSEEYGRHLVATREFNPGDLITMENPYSWVLYQDKFYTHCHHCLVRCYDLIPCPDCPLTQYCSEKCRRASWDLAHRIECPVLSVLFNLLNVDEEKIRTLMMMKIMRLVITVTDNGRKIKELREDMKIAECNPDPRTAGFTDQGILDTKSARSALSLATNMTTRPLIGVSAFACISALTAVLLATQSDLFGKKYDPSELKNIDELKDIAFCGSLMFRACVLASSNCFSMQLDPGVKSGSGLFVVHSLYNHSCAANTFRHFEGLTMLTRAQEPIHPGDQIFTGYGADHAYMARSERKAKLMEQYFFDCQCTACVNDWPTYPDILKNHIGSIAKNRTIVEKLKPYKKRLLDNKYDVEAVQTVLEILHSEVEQPCEEILHAVHYLKCYYLDP